ncbi:MAG TPA: hypothetical protein VF552_10300 [Allosphingosinicella sp.]|jgi:hypothetical protein
MSKLPLTAAAALGALALAACEVNVSSNDAATQNAIEDVRNGAADLVNGAGNVAADVGNELGEAARDAGNTIGDASRSAGNAADRVGDATADEKTDVAVNKQ